MKTPDIDTQNTFNITPASTGALAVIIFICVAMLAIIIVPAATEGFSWESFVVSLGICVLVFAVMGSFGYQGRYATFSLTDSGLRIKPGIYGRTIPKEKLMLAEACIIDLNYDRHYQPRWRMNGAGFPGYEAGWFKLNNGEKALMFVTDRSRVVYIPTTEKYAVMLSTRDADKMVRLLKKWR